MNNFSKLLTAVIAIIIISLAIFCATGHAKENSALEKKYVFDLNNTKCPVLGKEARKEIYAVHKNNIYHFCCESCVTKFKKNPAKFVKAVKPDSLGERIKYEIAGNENCPVMGNPINKDISAIKDGKLYYFCCPECIEKFVNEDQAQTQTVYSKENNLNEINERLINNSATENSHKNQDGAEGGGCH